MDLKGFGIEQSKNEILPLCFLLQIEMKVRGSPCALSRSLSLMFLEKLQLILGVCNTAVGNLK